MIYRGMDMLARSVTAAAVIFVLLAAWNAAGDAGRELAAILTGSAR